MIAGVKTNLAALKKQPGDIDNPEKAVSERIDLEYKLSFYEDQEKIESARVVAEHAKEKAQRRKTLLLELAEKTEQVKKQHMVMTNKTTKLIDALIIALIERDEIHTKRNVGLLNPELSELVTKEEYDFLEREYGSSCNGFYIGDVGKNFQNAIYNQTSGNDYLKQRLLELFTPAHKFHKPIKSCNLNLVHALKDMAGRPAPPPVTEKVEIVESKKPGMHQVADMHDNSPVIEI